MYKISLLKPYLDLIKQGKKTIEGRKNSIKYHSFKEKDKILFNYNDEECLTEIIKINKYKTIREYLENEGIEYTMPHVKSIEEGLEVFDLIYPNQIIKLLEYKYGYGFLGIHIKLV
tara:strand:- start:618 stop:965 length:348 start_codon:yes stop_codon:yes gene_type:complete